MIFPVFHLKRATVWLVWILILKKFRPRQHSFFNLHLSDLKNDSIGSFQNQRAVLMRKQRSELHIPELDLGSNSGEDDVPAHGNQNEKSGTNSSRNELTSSFGYQRMPAADRFVCRGGAMQIVEYSKRRTLVCCVLLEFDWIN